MDSFQGLTPKTPSSWHRSLAPKSWAILEDLALYDNESWKDPRDFAKPVKVIALPQDVPSTSDRRLIELENQVQRLMEAHFAPTQPTQVNKITTPCKICSGPHDIQDCMEILELAVVEYASSRTDEAGDARLSKFEADFKQQQSEMTNKIDIVLKAITDRIAGTLPSDMVKNPKLGTHSVSSARSYPTKDPQCSTQIHSSINTITIHPKQLEKSQLDEPEIEHEEGNPEDTNSNPQPQPDPFASIITEQVRKLNSMLESLGLVPQSFNTKFVCTKEDDGEVMFTTLIVKDVEIYIGKLKLLNDFYVLDMKKDPETPLLIGRGFLTTANAVIDYRMAKIAVGEGITRSVFDVKGVDLGEEEAPYWTILGKKESYKPQPNTDGIGAKPPYYARKVFIDCHLPREWEISRDAELNPF
ncbi:MAK10-like protein [Tanacetum coccineum]